jgi:hypothetical protein
MRERLDPSRTATIVVEDELLPGKIALEGIVYHQHIPGGISLCKRSKHIASGWTEALAECRNMYHKFTTSQMEGRVILLHNVPWVGPLSTMHRSSRQGFS